MIYITRGSGKLCIGEDITDGDLVRGQNISFTATTDDFQIIIIKTKDF